MSFVLKIAFASAIALAASTVSAATYTYVGSWTPDDPRAAPYYTTPLAYTGQEAAALLFGGTADRYVISTVDSNPDNINFSAVYDVINFGEAVFAQGYSNKYQGLYYAAPSGAPTGADASIDAAASTFVRDNHITDFNYAFRIDAIPEPQTWALMLAGFGLVGVGLRRRVAKPAAA